MSLMVLLAQILMISAFAAPYPATSSSTLTDPNKPGFYKSLPYTLKAAFRLGYDLDGNFQLTNESSSFFIKLVDMPETHSLDSFSKKWIKDYSSLGFNLLGTKAFTQNELRGLVIDLFHKKEGRQIRQVLFKGSGKVAILTCQDSEKSFSETLSECNNLTKSFTWNY